jgi:hypothetical protein
MGSAHSARPPVVRVSGRAQAELRAGEALVFDWTSLAFCCAAAGLRAAPDRGRSVGVRPPAGLPDAGRASHRGRLPAPPRRPLVLLLATPRSRAAHVVRA